MGNTQCCQSSDTSPDAAAEAMPAMESWPANPGKSALDVPTVSGGNTAQERTYKVRLVKKEGQKLGLDVDYMAERSVLPILVISGGIAEMWNKQHPDKKMNTGDSITEVNGIKGNVALMLEKCKADQTLELTVVKCLTYGHLVADLEKLMLVKGCGPIMVRLSWHDAGVFNGADGCPNAAMRLAGGGEHAFGANAGLPQVAIPLLQAISDKYVPRLISHADLWALAANVAIKVMGGPDIVTHFGRVDAQSPSDGATSAAGRLPDGDKDAQHLRDIFRPKGFTDKDIVALSGAHTVGACHADRSGFEGPWTADKLKFDNTYFQDLLNKTWSMETVKSGNKQYRSGKEMMLTTDMALVEDPKFKEVVVKYASNQGAFFDDFKEAWVKLQELGCGQLRDIL
mmetsp:Transcript_95808/g.228141  ORF Transcript_95808/g.228141 Transcript_95808/m.228141 type:complete len:398 (-) Transcript_95808:96-1289(-)|eukprot:CAMPEP_0181436230 /NCGR_PEP_ID=MMETSP1110-20121109/20741_1 /TAXON_ID=174948 /ORGANISM="Symbiodinium sp., Strain CCMP421" /LENGTH=397 /DNA_ID=CAMNT_0023559789 /DNA_START=68 /DNA_END=1261 /DNA_ORIENTATION=+